MAIVINGVIFHKDKMHPKEREAYERFFANGGKVKKIPQGVGTDPDVLAAMLRPKRGRKKKVKKINWEW